jgi:hypothetical protein
MRSKLFLSSMALLAAAVVSANSFVVPHILEKSGVILGVASNVTTTKSKNVEHTVGRIHYDDLDIAFSPETNPGLLSEMMDEVSNGAAGGGGAASTRIRFSLHKADHAAGGIAGKARIGFSSPSGMYGFSVPALDASSKDAAFFDIFTDYDARKQEGFFDISKEERLAIASQKNWLGSNFLVEIGGVACRTNKIDSFTVKQSIADLDGDGLLDLAISDVVLHMDLSDSALFREWFQSSIQGKEDVRPVTITLMDNSGQRMCAIRADMAMDTFDFFDIFTELSATGGTEMQARLVFKKGGHVTLLK